MLSFISHWCTQWLDNRGLHSISALLEARAAQGGDVHAMHAVAKRALHQGKHAQALAALEPALREQPNNAALWCTRGIAHRLALSYDDALTDYERAHRLDPKDVRTLGNMGEWYLARSSFEQALTWLDTALALDANYYEVRVNRVAALIELRRLEQAQTEAENLVQAYPGRPEPYGNLGNVLFAQGKLKESVAQYQKAVDIRPDYAEAHFSLVALLGFSGQQELVTEYLERCIEEKGETNQRQTLLAVAYKECGRLEKAMALSRKVIGACPQDLRANVNLAGCLSDTGNPQLALHIYEAVSAKDANQMAMASNALFEMNYLPGFSREDVYRHHLAWASKYEAPLTRAAQFDARNRDPERKLRVGYVSADFCAHPVGFLLRDVLRRHDRTRFELHCFSTGVKKDQTTAEITAAVDSWADVVFESLEELSSRMREADIDVLVDLSGHTGNHRLPTFALHPAPVQASWIGYFNTTGMSSMDYFISDPYTSPRGSGQLFSERVLHMPHSRFCFSKPTYAGDVAPSPLLRNGFVTFGSFNRLPKLSPRVLDAWSEILHHAPDSRLVLKAAALADDSVCRQFIDGFAQRGIDAARLDLRGTSAHHEMFAEYGDVDIALDPFPFNGGMTTLEALWMGVPVVTLEGNAVVSRQTFSALANIGLADVLAFSSVDAYVAGAVALAKAPARLSELRAGIRPRMEASPLCQPEVFTRDLEALYRRMWQAWCKGGRLDDALAAVADIVT